MINFDDQLEFFKALGLKLKKQIECLAIGGSAMMFYGAKEATKDVDLVFLNKKDMDEVKDALYDMGFEEKNAFVNIFKHYEIATNKPVMMVGHDTRFDLFVNEVISFKISKNIIERVKEEHKFNNLIMKIISPEDIILLKCATEREKDRDDALSLMKSFDIDWEIIFKESIHQMELGGDIFPMFLYDFLIDLKDEKKADIPKDILNKIREKSEKILIKKLKDGTHIKVTDFTKKS